MTFAHLITTNFPATKLSSSAVQSCTTMSQHHVSASQARKDFFKILERVFEKNDSFVIEKSGIKIAEIKSLQQEPINHQLYAKILESTRGTWTKSKLFNKSKQLQQQKLETQETKKNKLAW